ncbi:hypothetical protein TrLO_g14906 [Triparma laevis f. longispina]|uniref:Glutamyl-tRNA(Gln) amidotransferase subunit A, mitochondrial n=1 Tax=Triparma laevis f. longispina TaxID=1714387 RepID=A0A9W7EEG5_9STRA|nr:hypothetical protein TrLO_g14906 [Triparma laevis f. longispina]
MITPSTTLTRLSTAFASKSTTPTAALNYCFERITLSETTHSLNTFTYLPPTNELRDQAAASSERYATNTQLSPIDGIPISVKANISWLNRPTSASSKMLEHYSSPIQADVIDRLTKSGAILIGQTNMDEFGMGSFTTNSAFGPSINSVPFLSSSTPPKHISPGGSSGGSASSVAFRSSFASIGTDTGGSVRLPAAYCGCTGFKPSYGGIPRHGVIPYASSLDTVGLITPTPEDAKLLHDVLRGESPNDPTSITTLSSPPKTSLSSLSIGVPGSYSVSESHPSITKSWVSAASTLSDSGATVTIFDDSLTSIQDSLAAYYVIACAEASSNLAKYDGVKFGSRIRDTDVNYSEEYANTRSKFFGSEVKRRIECGDTVLSKEGTHYSAALQIRNQLRDEYAAALLKYDVLLLPTSVSPPIDFDDANKNVDQNEMMANDLMTVGASLCGFPAISIPVSADPGEDFWVGMQIIGKHGDDDRVLDVANLVYEKLVVDR